MIKKAILILIIISAHKLSAQISSSVTNLLRYGNGEQVLGTSTNNFNYFENLTDVRLNFPEKVVVGFRLLYDDPPEVGLPFKGLSRRFIEYRKDKLYLRVGNSNELYGRGLVLNLFENRGLAYDTWIDGIKGKYRLGNFNASIIAGTIEFTDSINIIRTENYKIRGGNVEYKLLKQAKIGVSYITSEAKIPQFNQSTAYTKAELPEIYLDITRGPINLFLNWAHKWTNSSLKNSSSKGFGIYSALSYSGRKFGITIDYKNYRFDLQNPLSMNDETRTTKVMPFQNPPIVMKEHSYTLLSRALHQINFNDEVGFQIDGNYNFNKDFIFSFNFSLASLHDLYNFNSQQFNFNKIIRNNNFLPSSDAKYSPYTEVFGEAEYYFSLSTAIRLGAAYRKKISYNNFTGLTGSHTIKSFIVPMQFQHVISDKISGILQYEYENVDDNFNSGQEKYYNQFLSIVLSLYRNISVATRYEFTNNNSDLSGRTDWLLGEIGYRFSGKNLVTASYGRERGGQVCSNGICRYILPFKGFRLTLQTSL